jgi:hypothetical protein
MGLRALIRRVLVATARTIMRDLSDESNQNKVPNPTPEASGNPPPSLPAPAERSTLILGGQRASVVALGTAKGRTIPNERPPEWGPVQLAGLNKIGAGLLVTLRREATSAYNCHGLSFANRRTRIPDAEALTVIFQDEYMRIERERVLPGDIAVYRDGTDISHTGVVIEAPSQNALRVAKIVSKWGHGPEYIHQEGVVTSGLGVVSEFWRDRP